MKSYNVQIQDGVVIKTIIAKSFNEIDESLRELLTTIQSNTNGSKHVVGLHLEKRTLLRDNKSFLFCDCREFFHLCFDNTCIIIDFEFIRLNYKPYRMLLSTFLRHPFLSFAGVGVKEIIDTLEKKYKVDCKGCVTMELRELAAEKIGSRKFGCYGLLDLVDEVILPKEFASDLKKAAISKLVSAGLFMRQKKNVAPTDQHVYEASVWSAYLCFLVANRLLVTSPTLL